jgi:glucarate dehydratase
MGVPTAAPSPSGNRLVRASHDSMLMNLSGAHGPFFTRNIVILRDNAGNAGVGEVPGGDKIWQTLDDAREQMTREPLKIARGKVAMPKKPG